MDKAFSHLNIFYSLIGGFIFFSPGNTFTIGGVSGLVFLPFGNIIVRYVGEMNVIVLGVILESSRLVMMALIK